jgi:hypothetical protein
MKLFEKKLPVKIEISFPYLTSDMNHDPDVMTLYRTTMRWLYQMTHSPIGTERKLIYTDNQTLYDVDIDMLLCQEYEKNLHYPTCKIFHNNMIMHSAEECLVCSMEEAEIYFKQGLFQTPQSKEKDYRFAPPYSIHDVTIEVFGILTFCPLPQE